jgi:hypothetical protein
MGGIMSQYRKLGRGEKSSSRQRKGGEWGEILLCKKLEMKRRKIVIPQVVGEGGGGHVFRGEQRENFK